MHTRSAAALLLLSSFALAEAKQKPLAQELSGVARESFERAKDLFEASDFATAHAKFKQAYEASRNPRLLWNMAACSARLKRYARAIDETVRYLGEGRGKLNAEQVDKANGALAEWRSFVADAALNVEPGGATLHVDDEPRGVIGTTTRLSLDMGKHELRLEKSGYEALTRAIVIGDVGKPAITLTMKPVTGAAAHLVVNTELDATIEVDGKAGGKGLFDGKLEAGAHRVRITAPNKTPYESTVELAPGATKQLTISLNGDKGPLAPVASMPAAAQVEGAAGETSGGAWWPWAVGGAVLAAGAGVGAYYLFKPEQVPGPTGYVGTLGALEVR
jgi:hypothetical protein